MSAYTEKEIEYLDEQRLGRLATVDAEGRPHIVPHPRRIVSWGVDTDAISPHSRSVG
jgi:nitroimidazol reductase NimA-like FMN-containing flavoprotein (pyridoxamine 5'-phosphate oxidase superfamily)